MSLVPVLACHDFSPLIGKSVDAYFYAEGYWRFIVALRTTTNKSLVFSSEERGLVRIVDESGDDYLYPKEMFVPASLPTAIRRAVMQAE